jgi:molecular chaperone GrpE
MDNGESSKDDIEIEADADLDDSVVAEENAAALIKKLRAKLKESEAKTAEYLAGWQRTQADFINFKKRESSEREQFLKFAAEPVISDVLNALDDFDAAFSHKSEWEKADKAWRDGMTGIYNRLQKSLAKHGVSVIDPLGTPFDPAEHLAVEMVKVDSKDEDDKVVGVVHKGYKLHDRVIRPAKVKVGQIS